MSNNPITVSLSITDQVLCDGVTFAMRRANDGKPARVQAFDELGQAQFDADGQPVMIDNPEIFVDEAAYVRHVGAQAIKSYAQQKARDDFDNGLIGRAQRDAILAALA